VFRLLPIAGVALSLALTGCAGTWDTFTSRRFKDAPFTSMQRMMSPEDPLLVLRAVPPRDGDERARAMRRLKEPIESGGTQQDQDEIVELLARTATADPSPVLRLAAIEALGRFHDPRAAGVLMLAYQKAHGRPDGSPAPSDAKSPFQLVGGAAARVPGGTALDRSLTAPTGYAPDTVAVIRCRALESLGRTNRPEAVQFLAGVAGGQQSDAQMEGSDDRDVRLAAVRGLGRCRQPESVVVLAQVLGRESGKDTAVVGRAHDGLVRLTGKHLPPDPQKWDAVVQAGVTIAPEPTWMDNAVQSAVGWLKP
jgi:HEAT repeat protein